MIQNQYQIEFIHSLKYEGNTKEIRRKYEEVVLLSKWLGYRGFSAANADHCRAPTQAAHISLNRQSTGTQKGHAVRYAK